MARKSIPKDLIKKDLIRVKNKINRIPSNEHYRELGKYSHNTVERKYGSWNKALKEVFQDTNNIVNKNIKTSCKQCNKEISVAPSNLKHKKRKSQNTFCSKSCAATYNNTHKTHGTRRSKLEKYLEEELTKLYPKLEIHFNRKDAINSELDIYIPSLSLAFELNGIFHYEPIYGKDKLASIQNNDKRKFAACNDASISLCVIDTSSLNYFKPKKAEKYLNIIIKIINENLD